MIKWDYFQKKKENRFFILRYDDAFNDIEKERSGKRKTIYPA